MECFINTEFGVADTCVNEKGIFGKLLNSLFGGSVLKGQYTSKDDIPQKEYELIERYVTDGNSINMQVRTGNDTNDINLFRKLVGTHMITEDMILYRKSAQRDFNDVSLLNCPLEELVGKRITFFGFMSTTPDKVHAEKKQ